MPLPKEVRDYREQETTRFGPRNEAVRIKVVSYFIGVHGPYFHEFVADADATDKIIDFAEKDVEQLRKLGQLPEG